MALLITATGCKKDNYAAPSSTLKGHLVYKGDAVNVEYNAVPFLVYQPGFATKAPINGSFDPDGGYSLLLFDGNYKFTIPANQGPFMWKELGSGKRDTLAISLKGSQTTDIEVTPYYMLRSPKFTGSTGNKVSATFNIEKIITDANAKDIQSVILFVNKTQFVGPGNNYNIANTEVAGSTLTSMNNVTLNVNFSTITPTQNYVFARVGLKIAGVEDLIFTPATKVTF